MPTRTTNPLVLHFREIMREKGFRKHRSCYYLRHGSILLCLHLQRSIFAPAYFLNAGLADLSLLPERELPHDLSDWHAAGRSEMILGKAHETPYPDTTSKERLSQVIDEVIPFLTKAAEAIEDRDISKFPLAALWIQRLTQEELFDDRR